MILFLYLFSESNLFQSRLLLFPWKLFCCFYWWLCTGIFPSRSYFYWQHLTIGFIVQLEKISSFWITFLAISLFFVFCLSFLWPNESKRKLWTFGFNHKHHSHCELMNEELLMKRGPEAATEGVLFKNRSS